MYNFYFIVAIVVLLFELYGFTNTNFPSIHFHYRLSTSVGPYSANINLENQYSILRNVKEHFSTGRTVETTCPLLAYWTFSMDEYQTTLLDAQHTFLLTFPLQSTLVVVALLTDRVDVFQVISPNMFDDSYYEFSSEVRIEKVATHHFDGLLVNYNQNGRQLAL
jgi:hypothetical protein